MFTHLHLHTQFSLLDGACRLDRLVCRAKELGMTSLAITDHGNMYGAVDFYKECKRQGIKPIIGCEVYVAPRTRFDKEKVLDKEYNHLVLLVKNEIGYKNLIKMVSLSYTEGFYFKPRIDCDLLEKYSDGLVCLSACLAGEIPQLLLKREYDEARERSLWFNSVFGDGNYYLEIQNHGIPEQKTVIDGIVRLHDETGIPIVATNDVHYVNKEDAEIQQVLICIATNHTIGEDTGLEFHSDNFYLKSEDEMSQLFLSYPDAIENTQKIADMCNFDFEFGNTKLPYFETPDNMDHFEYFKLKCFEGLHKRYGENVGQSYIDRLNYELETVEKMGYTDYYLIVWDFVAFAKSKGIPVGPGRGSGAGSLAAYCIGITDLDPMKYDLIFERFLNPERVSMPDFDIDFCYERRQEVIDYVTQKYGSDHVAQIVTFGTLQTRAAIRDVGRAMGMSYSSVDAVAKLIPNSFHITIDQAVERSRELRRAMDENAEVKKLIDTARKVEGMPRNTSTHAAGVVITHDPVSSYVPLATNDGLVVTQYIMTTLEELGLLKMDFLGLRTLTVIDDASKAAGIDINKIPIDDANVYKIFARGKTEGIFQFESAGMKQMLMNLKPKALEDLIAATSLYRPGPASQIDTFVQNSQNPQNIKYDTPMLEPILKNTYGCMVYQEQVMQIVRDLAGYSLGRSDLLRRAMSKKKQAVMEKERQSFVYGNREEGVKGCIKNGISEEIANKIYDEMIDFAKYAFNKSHAAAYGVVAYQTAYLKYYYAAEFMAAMLTSVMDISTKVAEYVYSCRSMGIEILPPDINEGESGFSAKGNSIRYGLTAIKNVGKNIIDGIVEEREKHGKYTDLEDFITRTANLGVNKRAIENFIKAGAFDSLNATRKQMMMVYIQILDGVNKENKDAWEGQMSIFDMADDSTKEKYKVKMPDVGEYTVDQKLAFEKEVIGIYASGHPLQAQEQKWRKHITNMSIDFTEPEEGEESKVPDKSKVAVGGIISAITKKFFKTGQQMAFITLEDLVGTVEVVVFPRQFERSRMLMEEGQKIFVKGEANIEENSAGKVLANSIVSFDQVPSELWIAFKDKEEYMAKEKELLETLLLHKGGDKVMIALAKERQQKALPIEYRVDANNQFIEELKKTYGQDFVKLRV